MKINSLKPILPIFSTITGRNLEVITYNAENQPFGGMRFYYDKKGRVNKSQSSFSLGDGELLVNRQYFYNEKKPISKNR